MKICVVLNMKLPQNIREVQKLARRLAMLGHFVSRLAEKGLPFFKVLHGSSAFEWTAKSQAALDDLKGYLTSPHCCRAPSMVKASSHI